MSLDPLDPRHYPAGRPSTFERLASRILAYVTFGFLAMILLSFCQGPTGITKKARQMKMVSNSKQIVLAIQTFAIDNDGDYPQYGKTYEKYLSDGSSKKIEVLSATSAFDVLVPEYMPSEKIFWDQRSANPEPIEDENLTHSDWALIDGMNDGSPDNLPLVFTPPDQRVPHPVWERPTGEAGESRLAWEDGRRLKVVIAYNDGSAALETVEKDGQTIRGQNPFRFLDEEAEPTDLKIMSP